MGLNSRYIIDFSQVNKVDEDLVGKKAHELGRLWELGVPLPNGFVITTRFFKDFLCLTGIDKEIKKVQALDHPAISDSVRTLLEPVQQLIMSQHIPESLVFELHEFYRKLAGEFNERSLNVFSSSFNNKSIAFLDIKGDANLILRIKAIWALCLEEPVAIAVQENIISEINPAPFLRGALTSDANRGILKKCWIKGKISTDNPVIDKNLTESQMKKLVDYCNIIQKHFYFPKEIEYVVKKGKIYITKVNPHTGSVDESPKPKIQDKTLRKILARGISINPGIATGPVKVLLGKYANIKVKNGEIIVLPKVDLSVFKKIKNVKAVVVDSVLSNSLQKMLYRRDFKFPTVEGTENATRMIQTGNVITVNGVSGEIYSGGLVY